MASNLAKICVLTLFFFCLNSTFGIPLSENVMVLTKGKQHNRVTRQADEIGNLSVPGSNTKKEQESISNKNTINNEIKNKADGPNVEQEIITSSVAASTATAVSAAGGAGVEHSAAIAASPVPPALPGAFSPPPSLLAPILQETPVVAVAAAPGVGNRAPHPNNALNTGPAANTGANANGVNGVTNTNGGFGTNTGVGLNTITVLNLDDRENDSPYKDGLNININPAVAVNGEGKLASSTTSVESISSAKAVVSALAMNLKGKRKSSLNAKKAQLIEEIERETDKIRSRYDEKKIPHVDLKENEERIDDEIKIKNEENIPDETKIKNEENIPDETKIKNEENIPDETKIKNEENIPDETKIEKVEQQEGSDKKTEEIEEIKEDQPRRKYRPTYENNQEEYDPYDENDDLYERRRPSYGRRPQEEEVDRLIRLLESIRNAK